MNTRLWILGYLLLICSFTQAKATEIYTSTRQITALASASDGSLWAATKGGVLQRKPDGTWCKFTRMDGLPSNEIIGVTVDSYIVTAVSPEATARFINGQWCVDTTPPKQISKGENTQTASTIWDGRECLATLTELRIKEKDKWKVVALPPGRGSHISALLPRGDHLWAAMFGDGIWDYNGKSWSRADVGLPRAAREITCMVDAGSSIWLGTRREGLWQYIDKHWTQELMPDEPYDHNSQSMTTYKGDLYISTLEDGLVVKTAKGWIRYSDAAISSNAPRQMVVCGNCLYVRHGNGKVDRFDGRTWFRDVCANLPRKQASTIASDCSRLYVAQWGGWSEFDGKSWKHNLKFPELQGYAITALMPGKDRLWIGTQGRGLSELDTNTGKLTWYDESNGMPDDWIKVIAQSGNLHVGTFVGGLATWNGTKRSTTKGLSGMEITALVPDSSGKGIFIGTRNGLFHMQDNADIIPISSFIGCEIQALQLTDGELWIGTRTGIYMMPLLSKDYPNDTENIMR